MSRDQPASVGPIIVAAACLGALVGILVRPVWTDNLIGAQILAGTVTYPPDSLMPLVYLRPHSLLTQVAAVLLRSGVGDWYVALVFCGLQGAVGMAALSALTLVFSRQRLAAFFVPLVLLRFAESLPMWPGDYLRVFHGHLYPNTFPVGPGVFGVVGLFVGLLALALIGLDRRRPAALALGLLPAIHVGMAVPFWLAIGVVQVVARWRPAWATPALALDRRTTAWFGAGLAVSLVSVAVYLTYVPTAVSHAGDGAVVAQLLQGWDDHTRALRPWEWVGLFESELYTLILAIALLVWRPADITDGALTATRLVVVITVVGMAYTLIAQAVPSIVPDVVRAALVTRWLNVSSWFFPVVDSARSNPRPGPEPGTVHP